MEKNILGLHKFNGGIEELSLKISQIRTWTYISNHPNWIDNENYWQEKTQDIENNLSDKLHEGLINRFVDSTSKYFISLQNDDKKTESEIKNKKTLVINNIEYGSFIGFDLKFNKDVISHSLFSLSHVKKSTRLMIEEKINNFLRSQAEPDYIDEILNFVDEKELGNNAENQGDKDELYNSALEIIRSEGKASTSFLQRKLQIGYNRAARIIDMMEVDGIVSKANHVGKRDVL